MDQMVIKIKAESRFKGGITEIYIPAKPLQEADHEKLRQLFPNTLDRVYKLLEIEALLSHIQ